MNETRSRAVWVLPLLTLVFQLATAGQLGYFRDELYYLANGRHLGFGYVDHPPFVALVAWLVQATVGESQLAIRILPALTGAGVVALTVRTARVMGGGGCAQWLAGIAVALAPIVIAQAGFFSMNAFDMLAWTLVWWLVARALHGGSERLWLWIGLVCGIGLQNKISVLFLGFGLAVGFALARREVLRIRQAWLGAGLAVVLFAPYLAWEVANGWPTLEFMENARRYKMVEMPAGAFLFEQVLLAGPSGLLVWTGGLAWLLLSRAARPFRALGWAFVAVLVALMLQDAKPYYVGTAYPVLFAAGGVAWETWTARFGKGRLRVTLVVLLLAPGLLAVPLAKPVMPLELTARYMAWVGLRGAAAEVHEQGRLPQFFADRIGWPEIAQSVAEVYETLTPQEQERARIYGGNYGQAGAIDLFGPALGLPPALSGHNSYWLWGPGDWSGEVLIVIGEDRPRLEELFESVELGTVYTCTDCMPFESEKAIWIARGLRMPVEELWLLVKHYE